MTSDILFSPQPNFDRWLTTARRASVGGYTRDAILGGLRARLFTNQLAVAEAWSDTFFGPQEWQTLVGQTPPPQVAMSFCVVVTEKSEPVAAIDPVQSVGLLVNRTEESLLLDIVVALAASKLAAQAGWVTRGTCVAAGERGALVTGPGHAFVAAEIAIHAAGQIAVNDPVLVRLTLTRQVDGVQLAPTRIITERGQEITGARIWQWLRRNAYQEPRADVVCLTLEGRDEPVMARDLDLDRCAEPYAYPLTRVNHKPGPSPLVTDAVALFSESHLAVLSVDTKTFVTRLTANLLWTPQDVVQEVAQAMECHTAGAVSPQDQNLQYFVAEIAKRLRATHR
jgi:hypothetical protein